MFFSIPKYIPQAQYKINHWISFHLMIICLKDISVEGFSFNGNASLKFLINVPLKKPISKAF